MSNNYIKLKESHDTLLCENIKLKQYIYKLNNNYITLEENNIKLRDQHAIYISQYTVLYNDYIFINNFIKQLYSYSINLLIDNINKDNMIHEVTDKKTKFLDKLLEYTNIITDLETSLTEMYKLLSYFMYI